MFILFSVIREKKKKSLRVVAQKTLLNPNARGHEAKKKVSGGQVRCTSYL